MFLLDSFLVFVFGLYEIPDLFPEYLLVVEIFEKCSKKYDFFGTQKCFAFLVNLVKTTQSGTLLRKSHDL